MNMGQNMIQTGLQSLFVLLLVPVQHVGGQDLAGVLSTLQGQAGEVLVKGDSVGCLIHYRGSMLGQILHNIHSEKFCDKSISGLRKPKTGDECSLHR